MKFSEYLGEKSKYDYEVYHKSYTSAVGEAKRIAELKGYEIDEDDWHFEITTGSGRPKKGETVNHSVKLLKNGKKQKKALQIQVHDMESGKYELNTYIN